MGYPEKIIKQVMVKVDFSFRIINKQVYNTNFLHRKNRLGPTFNLQKHHFQIFYRILTIVTYTRSKQTQAKTKIQLSREKK